MSPHTVAKPGRSTGLRNGIAGFATSRECGAPDALPSSELDDGVCAGVEPLRSAGAALLARPCPMGAAVGGNAGEVSDSASAFDSDEGARANLPATADSSDG